MTWLFPGECSDDSFSPSFYQIGYVSNSFRTHPYDYDVECKLVRVKRQGKSHDYCQYYVTDGVQRFQDGIYAQSLPPMGAMIGYAQEGELISLLQLVNDANRNNEFEDLHLQDTFSEEDVTLLTQQLHRPATHYILTHFWTDLR